MTDIRKKLQVRLNRTMMSDVLNRQLGLENLKRHSFENTMTGGTKDNSSVLSGSVEDPRLNNGRPTLVPFLYEGRIVDGQEAVDLAVSSRRVWPAFKTNDEATAASKKVSNRLGQK